MYVLSLLLPPSPPSFFLYSPSLRMLACLYLTAQIFLDCGMTEAAKTVFTTLLTHIVQLWDSSEDANSASPFEVELHLRLRAIAEEMEDEEGIEKHTSKLKVYKEVFGDAMETLPDTVGEWEGGRRRRRVGRKEKGGE
jgi:hypothetical protein